MRRPCPARGGGCSATKKITYPHKSFKIIAVFLCCNRSECPKLWSCLSMQIVMETDSCWCKNFAILLCAHGGSLQNQTQGTHHGDSIKCVCVIMSRIAEDCHLIYCPLSSRGTGCFETSAKYVPNMASHSGRQ